MLLNNFQVPVLKGRRDRNMIEVGLTKTNAINVFATNVLSSYPAHAEVYSMY
jgi:hypothetical protein